MNQLIAITNKDARNNHTHTVNFIKKVYHSKMDSQIFKFDIIKVNIKNIVLYTNQLKFQIHSHHRCIVSLRMVCTCVFI